MFAEIAWSQGVEDAWSNVAAFVPKFVAFLLILLVGYFVAKLIGKAADAFLERVGFDRAVERGGIKRALERTKYDASDIISKVIFYALFLIVLQMAFGVFGANPVSDMLAGVVAYLPKVIAAIAHHRHRRGDRRRRPGVDPSDVRRPVVRQGAGEHRGDRHRHRWHVRRPGPAEHRTSDRDGALLRA